MSQRALFTRGSGDVSLLTLVAGIKSSGPGRDGTDSNTTILRPRKFFPFLRFAPHVLFTLGSPCLARPRGRRVAVRIGAQMGCAGLMSVVRAASRALVSRFWRPDPEGKGLASDRPALQI